MNKILVFDEDYTAGKIIRSMLQAAGYETKSSTNLFDAACILLGFHPDLIITDFHSRDGERLAVEVKEHSSELPVIMLVSGRMPNSHDADCIVAKPVNSSELLHAVQELLKKRGSFPSKSVENAPPDPHDNDRKIRDSIAAVVIDDM